MNACMCVCVCMCRMLENVLPDKAIALYIRGGDVAEVRSTL